MNPLGIVKGIIGPWYGQPSTAELQAQVDRLTADKMELARQIDAVSRDRDEWKSDAVRVAGRLGLKRLALSAIAAQETPGANATVKRMARMAREALE